MTRDELIAKLTDFRIRKISLTWAEVATAFSASAPAVKTQLVAALNERNANMVVTTMMTIIDDKRKQLATADITAMLADDILTTDDLIALLG